MKDSYVSESVLKLVKEKGFVPKNGITHYFASESGTLIPIYSPILSEVLDWMEEQFKIQIKVDTIDNHLCYTVLHKTQDRSTFTTIHREVMSTYLENNQIIEQAITFLVKETRLLEPEEATGTDDSEPVDLAALTPGTILYRKHQEDPSKNNILIFRYLCDTGDYLYIYAAYFSESNKLYTKGYQGISGEFYLATPSQVEVIMSKLLSK